MEGVEEANERAVESCNRVLNVISQPQDVTQYRNLGLETEEAVSSFKRVVSLLGTNSLGHARARIVKTNKTTTFHQNNLLERVNGSLANRSEPVKGLQQLKADLNECPILENGSTTGGSCLSLGGNLSNLSLERSSCGKSPFQIGQFPQTAHYQFLQQQQIQQIQQQKLQFQQHQLKHQNEMMHGRVNNGINLNFNESISNTRSFISSLSIDGSVTNLNRNGFNLMGASHSLDQNSSQHKKRCLSRGEDGSVICKSSGRCHCAKKRKNKVRRSVKVPAISEKLADIPPDEYSWRKYGQKPIKGSPYPRGYYKCSTVKGCPAKKHVERCLEESSMLIVTYEDEHNHPCVASRVANA